MKRRRLIALLAGALMALSVGAPAALAGGEEDGKCNAGRGNGPEPVLADCDPGNSGGNNQGGD
jgi:hypothetical protein